VRVWTGALVAAEKVPFPIDGASSARECPNHRSGARGRRSRRSRVCRWQLFTRLRLVRTYLRHRPRHGWLADAEVLCARPAIWESTTADGARVRALHRKSSSEPGVELSSDRSISDSPCSNRRRLLLATIHGQVLGRSEVVGCPSWRG